MTSGELSTSGVGGKILLAGDISNVFLDIDAIWESHYEVHKNMLDAIEAAASGRFSVIAVSLAGGPTRLSAGLRALREVNPGAKIILLSQMYEEPIAVKLLESANNGEKVIDDYLICPVEAGRLYECAAETGVGVERALKAGQSTEKRMRELERLATEDDLTGLKNRRYIWEFGRQIIEYAKREGGRVTLLTFDIDDFKHYNDKYGHPVGDEILKQAAVLMRHGCRGHDVVGRIGGDEFAVIFWDDPQRKGDGTESERRAMAEHPKEAIFIAKRFIKELEKSEFHLLGSQGKGVLTISGGLASFPRDGAGIDELFKQADSALMAAKRSGKNRIYLVGKPSSDIADIE